MHIETYQIIFATLYHLKNQRQHVLLVLIGMKQQDCPIELHSNINKALAPRGAYSFDIIILYSFHTGSRSLCCRPGMINPTPAHPIRRSLSSPFQFYFIGLLYLA